MPTPSVFFYVFRLMALYSYILFLYVIFLPRSLGLKGVLGHLSRYRVSTNHIPPNVGTAMGLAATSMVHC